MPPSTDGKKLILAIDGGGTSTRCAAYTLDGTQIAIARSGPSNHLSNDRSSTLHSLQTCMEHTLKLCNALQSDVVLVTAGLAGVDFDGAGSSEMKMLLLEAGYRSAVIHGDMVTAHAGALNGKAGVIAIAGTGSSFFGISPDGNRLKIGGYGYVFGDEGSGYWIATQALRAASKAYDGRGPQTRLVELLSDALRASPFSAIPRSFYSQQVVPARVAELSKVVQAAATEGDSIAIDILLQAGLELAIGTASLIHRLHQEAQCAVSYYGSVLSHCPLVLQAFQRELIRRSKNVTISPPAFDALYGAFSLGKIALESESI